jgi:hypothetical protein
MRVRSDNDGGRHAANSPDLSRIENLWRILEQSEEVKGKEYRGIPEVDRKGVGPNFVHDINKFILMMEQHVQDCIDRNGDVTED